MRNKVFNKLDLADRELNQLWELLLPYSEQQLSAKPSANAWSAKENIYHLIKAENLAHRYLEKKLSRPTTIEAAGWKSRWRSFKLQLVFASPFKVPAPAIVSPVDMPDLSTEAMKNQWMQQRKELRAYLETLPVEVYGKAVFNHAVVGRLSLPGMVDFFRQHLTRHQGQIRRTLKQVS